MPSIFTSRAPGIAFAVARPPEGLHEPVLGAVDDDGRHARSRRRRGVRSPEAMIAASWRPEPAGLRPRS